MILWCSDGLSPQDHIAWQNKLNELNGKIDYWRNDVIDNTKNLDYLEQDRRNMTVTNEQYLAEKTSIEKEIKMSQTNWRSEERQMEYELARGPQANTSTEATTAGTVRNISEVSGSNEQGPSKR